VTVESSLCHLSLLLLFSFFSRFAQLQAASGELRATAKAKQRQEAPKERPRGPGNPFSLFPPWRRRR